MATKDDVDLRNAAKEGNVELMQQLIKRGVSVNSESKYGLRPLHVAAQNGQTAAAEFLVANGADVNAQTKSGESPLHASSKHGFAPVVELLLKSGATVNAVNSEGASPLHLACEDSQKDVIKLLLTKGADRDLKFNGKSATDMAKDDVLKIFQDVKPVLSAPGQMTPTEKMQGHAPPSGNTAASSAAVAVVNAKPAELTNTSSLSSTTTPVSSVTASHANAISSTGLRSVPGPSANTRSLPNLSAVPSSPQSPYKEPVQPSCHVTYTTEDISISALLSEMRQMRHELGALREQVAVLSQSLVPPVLYFKMNGRLVMYKCESIVTE